MNIAAVIKDIFRQMRLKRYHRITLALLVRRENINLTYKIIDVLTVEIILGAIKDRVLASAMQVSSLMRWVIVKNAHYTITNPGPRANVSSVT
jgi:hypothetical protein